ncbi:hypothetical protein PoHVEF18_001998 [Penicillium ochrochloron]
MAEDTPINPTPAMMNPVVDKKKKNNHLSAVRSEEETAEQHSESVPRLATLEGENQQMPSLKENDTSQSPGQQRKQAPARRYQLRPEAPVFIPSASRPSGFPGFAGSALNPAASSFVPSSRPAIAAPRPDDPNVAGIRGIANSSPPAQHSRVSPACSQPSQRSAALIPLKISFSKILSLRTLPPSPHRGL